MRSDVRQRRSIGNASSRESNTAHVFRARAPPRVPLVQRRGIGRRAKSQKCGAEKAQDSCNGLPPSGTSLRAEREESSSMSQPRRLAAFAFVAGLVSAPPAWAWHIAGQVFCDRNGNKTIDASDTTLDGVGVLITSLTTSP